MEGSFRNPENVMCLFTLLYLISTIDATEKQAENGIANARSSLLLKQRQRFKREDEVNITESETFEVNEITEPCLNRPCKNGGKCTPNHQNAMKDFQCTCAVGYTGKTCEEEIQLCVSMKCIRKGDCLLSPSGVICICDYEEGARLCKVNSDKTSPWVTIQSVVSDPMKHLLVLVFGLTLSCLSIVAVCLGIHCCRASAKSKQLREEYKAKLQERVVPADVPPDLLSVSNALCRNALCCGNKPVILKNETDGSKDTKLLKHNKTSNSNSRSYRKQLGKPPERLRVRDYNMRMFNRK